ncbi:MAG: ATP-binding cassette domain-containing protein [Pseudomonadota bacterium]
MISINGFEKSYGQVQAARGITFDARDGEITTLLGLNGSGKSTTLRAIAGTLTPDRGTVRIDGVDIQADSHQALRALGVFPDRFGLYPRLSVREHLAHIAELHALARVESAIAAVSAQLGLGDILDRRTEGFSEGQRMRTGIAMSLLHNPQNLVLDEPSRGLDVLGVRDLRTLLCELRDAGRAILFSSHVLAEVEEIADRIVIIDSGQVLRVDSPRDLRGNCASLEDAVLRELAA